MRTPPGAHAAFVQVTRKAGKYRQQEQRAPRFSDLARRGSVHTSEAQEAGPQTADAAESDSQHNIHPAAQKATSMRLQQSRFVPYGDLPRQPNACMAGAGKK